MKKILICFLFLFFSTSCFSKQVENIGDNKQTEERNELISSGVIENLGKNANEVVKNFYSNDSEKQKFIKDWLDNKDNQRFSASGDIIEFLDYCENFKKEVKNNDDLNNFLYKYSEDEYKDIFETDKKLENIDLNKVIKQLDSEKESSSSFYKKLFQDFSKNNSINCEKYINE